MNTPPHNPWDLPPNPWDKTPEQHPSWSHFGPHDDRQWEEDAIAYATYQKMRRDQGEEIEDDDFVDDVFGESPEDRAAPQLRGAADDGLQSTSGASTASPLLTVLVVVVMLVIAAGVCSAALMGY